MRPEAISRRLSAPCSRMRAHWAGIIAASLVGVVALSTTGATASTGRSGAATNGSAPKLHVSGNRLVDANGNKVFLRGVNRSGTEYMCVDGFGIFDGPADRASILAMKSWHINAVRILLNEACWNGDSYVKPAYSGSSYRSAIRSYVQLLNVNGMVAILDLHWSDGAYTAPTSTCVAAEAVCQKPMPDSKAVWFWKSVGQAFKGNRSVIFDLFNEPYPEEANGGSETLAWQCWLYGGSSCTGISYHVMGMQSLVTAVRSTGAVNVIMLGGIYWANDLSQWLTYKPSDPLNNLAASWHSYSFNACSKASCWNNQIAPVIAQVPVITGELGEDDCSSAYQGTLLPWLDSHSASYLAFAWDNWSGGCGGYPALITDYAGDPTAYGAAYQAHLLSWGSRHAALWPAGMPGSGARRG